MGGERRGLGTRLERDEFVAKGLSVIDSSLECACWSQRLAIFDFCELRAQNRGGGNVATSNLRSSEGNDPPAPLAENRSRALRRVYTASKGFRGRAGPTARNQKADPPPITRARSCGLAILRFQPLNRLVAEAATMAANLRAFAADMELRAVWAGQTGGAAFAVLGGLQKMPREKSPEIYGIGTGNKFQVTPIFDPSGQALRFKFDYVGSTRVTEPSGGVDPQLPRIKPHTVNTEVQLSNLETREISRFESTSKIGIPTHYWGGVPIFKDIPYFRPYVPLLGWFVRRAGQNAVAQQSVIFGQTTVYPSISDLAVLLSPEDPTSAY